MYPIHLVGTMTGGFEPAVKLEAEKLHVVPIIGIPILALTLRTEKPVEVQATPVALSLWL